MWGPKPLYYFWFRSYRPRKKGPKWIIGDPPEPRVMSFYFCVDMDYRWPSWAKSHVILFLCWYAFWGEPHEPKTTWYWKNYDTLPKLNMISYGFFCIWDELWWTGWASKILIPILFSYWFYFHIDFILIQRWALWARGDVV